MYKKEYFKDADNYKIEIEGNKIIISYDKDEWGTKSNVNITFNINEIEALEESVNTTKDLGCFYELVFSTSNKKKLIKVQSDGEIKNVSEFYIPLYRGTNCDLKISEFKIYKALNHLRKLSGAPEPLKF